MNNFFKTAAIVLSMILFCTSCDKQNEEEEEEDDTFSPLIEGLTIDSYPHVDGSTSTAPLNMILACKLLGVDYNWTQGLNNSQYVKPDLNSTNSDKINALVKSSQTHQSFVNLINKDADLILSARKMSDDEKALADTAGVTLIETPIALDAFVFIVHPSNTVKSLTHQQAQDIYTRKITNWKEVGGRNAEIHPYVRNANSGSQELMEALVMKGIDIADLPTSYYELMAFTMTGAFDVVNSDEYAICYTVYYYKEHIITHTPLIGISINGVIPDKMNIANKSYPYVAEVYAVIREDLDTSSMAHQVYEWIQTEVGKQTISESGYVLYR